MLTKNELKRLLSEGQTGDVIEALLQFAQANNDTRLHNDAIHASARYQQAERDRNNNVILPEAYRIELAQIRQALVALIDRLPKEELMPATQAQPAAPPVQPPTAGNVGAPVFTGTGDGGGRAAGGTGDGGKTTRPAAWITGLALLVGMVLLLVFVPCPTEAQFFAFRLALALAAGGLATLLPGMFGLEWNGGIKAAGALGLAAMVYFVNPGEMASGGKCPSSEPFDFTVRLQKADLPNYPPLLGGNLKIWVFNRYEKPELNSDLLAEVKGIPATQAGSRVDVSLEDATYWTLASDSVTLSPTSQTRFACWKWATHSATALGYVPLSRSQYLYRFIVWLGCRHVPGGEQGTEICEIQGLGYPPRDWDEIAG